MTNQGPPDVNIRDLTYKFPDGSAGLHDITIELPAGSRTLLIGANGAGKTTLLRLASGKRLAKAGSILVGGVDPFTHGLEGVTYLGLVRNDISVDILLSSVGGDAYPARRDQLVEILDIDTTWRMHAVSDGERRRVQLAMGLLRPWSILLLDEVTVDLDVLARSRFLNFLKTETEIRPCSIVYATHIMDGLSGWPTHLVRMTQGRVQYYGRVEGFFDGLEKSEKDKRNGGVFRNSALLDLVLKWLKEDLVERGPRKGRKTASISYEAVEKEPY
ncbi:CCR4-NOT regulatory complex component [Rhizina undulata]